MKYSTKIICLLVGLALMVVLVVSLTFHSFRQIATAAEARRQISTVISLTGEMQSELLDAETGLRGYLLTGEESFLQPYLAVRDTVKVRLAQLRQTPRMSGADKNLDALVPLIDTKLAYFAKNIELRRAGNLAAPLVNIRGMQGKPLMDSIRAEIDSFSKKQGVLLQSEAEFQSKLRMLFAAIAFASLMTLLLALAFAYLIYKESKQRLKDIVHLETEHLLEIQKDSNTQLAQANVSLQENDEKTRKLLAQLEISQYELEAQNTDLQRSQQELETSQVELEMQNESLCEARELAMQLETVLRDSKEQLAVTLNSIGDAVIATDDTARITRMNPVAEQLTGWSGAEASGHLVDEIFHIVNKETRLPAPIPIMAAILHGTSQGLANHTVLIARDGSEYDIADSCSPIRNREDQVIGAVLVFRDVTEEYLVQQSMRDSAALMRAILNTVVDGIITIHAHGALVETVNPAAELMFGYTAKELEGQNFSLLIPELDQDQRDGSLEYYSASEAARASGHGREVMGKRKDGSYFPLELAASEMWMGGQRYFTGILRDISARKLAEEALVKAGALQSAIFNSANFSSIATDAKGVIQIFNVGAERMLGYTAAEVMNKITPAEISDPQEVILRAETLSSELGTAIAPGFEALVFKASRSIEDIYELTYIRKDGSRFPAVVSVTALRDVHNAIIGYLLIGTDNTARKLVEAERVRLEQVLQDKNIELERATLVAEKANLAKSDFLSSMSHELRTPLSAILGFAQLVESGSPQPTPNQKRSIDQILKAGWYLLELINEILDLALIESGKLSMSLEPVSLPEVMHECETMIEPEAIKHAISVTFQEFALPCFIEADRTRVKQVLINLLSNAIKYNRAGGTVLVESVVNGTESVRINVRDTGAGLTPKQLAQLFQPFNRLGQESSGEQGTGIGLVVSKRLVELMGGVIGVESTVGVGSVFWIEMSLMAKPHAPAYSSGTMTAVMGHKEGDAPTQTLLYVEDNPANMMLVEDIIARRPDIRLLTARNGKSGIELARASLPDVILMDINLPGISGIDAMKILAVDQTTAHIPVVALSANAMPRDIEMGLKAGFFRYLTKPINVDKFMDTLNIALNYAKTKGHV
ncbi:MAG TPA: PAS domain S-box protein [Desulfuromonadales bacterium]|nr:PAS domain S-box protein [Desulfuromonadales bacterium]